MTKGERRQALDDVIINLANLSKWAINARKDESNLNLTEDSEKTLINTGANIILGLTKIIEYGKNNAIQHN